MLENLLANVIQWYSVSGEFSPNTYDWEQRPQNTQKCRNFLQTLRKRSSV